MDSHQVIIFFKKYVICFNYSCTCRALYDQEKAGKVRLVPKLTIEHVVLPPIWGKMSVRLAAQVLSR